MSDRMARKRPDERPLGRRQVLRVILPAVERLGELLGRPALDEGQGGDHADTARWQRLGSTFPDPPVEGGAPADDAVEEIGDRVPVLRADVAVAAEIGREGLVGGGCRGCRQGEKLDRRLDAAGGGHDLSAPKGGLLSARSNSWAIRA